MTHNPYEEHGFNNRDEYLQHLAMENSVEVEVVQGLANLLGESEDFDGLVNALEDIEC